MTNKIFYDFWVQSTVLEYNKTLVMRSKKSTINPTRSTSIPKILKPSDIPHNKVLIPCPYIRCLCWTLSLLPCKQRTAWLIHTIQLFPFRQRFELFVYWIVHIPCPYIRCLCRLGLVEVGRNSTAYLILSTMNITKQTTIY